MRILYIDIYIYVITMHVYMIDNILSYVQLYVPIITPCQWYNGSNIMHHDLIIKMKKCKDIIP